ncbi:MAG: hypothetical protein HYR83_03475 [Planctomycetes bacterium]|nr:hypothetical protein [Planctomycetota bacterium]
MILFSLLWSAQTLDAQEVAACCAYFERPDPFNPDQTYIVEDCQNLTEQKCNAHRDATPHYSNAPPLYPGRSPTIWQPGRLCGRNGQQCPRLTCIGVPGDCLAPHTTPGCNNQACCERVCQSYGEMLSCCDVEWDEECVNLALLTPECASILLPNDECNGPAEGAGAQPISLPGTANALVSRATENPTDPKFCCHNGFAPHCIGGASSGAGCVTDADCPDGICPPRIAQPNPGVGTVWFKFVATQSSAQISTCRSSNPANDSLIEVFEPSDDSSAQAACSSLAPIGCNDDAGSCGVYGTGTNSKSCVHGLIPGKTYYVMLAAKTEAEKYEYILDIDAPCDPETLGSECGAVGACCGLYQEPDQVAPALGCHDLTRDQCIAPEPNTPADPVSPGMWQEGKECGVNGQSCPIADCISSTGSCFTPHATLGCDDPYCCQAVCTQFGDIGAYCCNPGGEWDDTCVQLSFVSPDYCHRRPTIGDCAHARQVIVPDTVNADTSLGINLPQDPVFCCHSGFPPKCVGGDSNGEACTTNADCLRGICPTRTAGPVSGVGVLWFQFVAQQTSVSLSTCRSNSPANDSLIQVFDCTDHSNAQSCCDSIFTIGCNDDAPGCGENGTNSHVCVTNLTQGKTYYVALAAKTMADSAEYVLDVNSPCTPQSQVPNDFCTNSFPVTDGVTPFNLAGATPDCPAEPVLPSMVDDIWYNYTATRSGSIVIQTCGADFNSSPDTTMAVYQGCTTCPPNLPPPVCASDFVGGNCGAASKCTINATQGQCYRIRLGDSLGNPVTGNLTINSDLPCPSGSITANTPPNNTVDARRPHDPDDSAIPLGISSVTVNGPAWGSAICFSVCETTHTGTALAISNVAPGLNVTFNRPIFPGALAKLTYPNGGSVTYISHPGNVNGDAASNSADVSALVTFLGGGAAPTAFGLLSTDIDRSNKVTPLDILDEVDLLNGASQYQAWNGTTKPTPNASCP